MMESEHGLELLPTDIFVTLSAYLQCNELQKISMLSKAMRSGLEGTRMRIITAMSVQIHTVLLDVHKASSPVPLTRPPGSRIIIKDKKLAQHLFLMQWQKILDKTRPALNTFKTKLTEASSGELNPALVERLAVTSMLWLLSIGSNHGSFNLTRIIYRMLLGNNNKPATSSVNATAARGLVSDKLPLALQPQTVMVACLILAAKSLAAQIEDVVVTKVNTAGDGILGMASLLVAVSGSQKVLDVLDVQHENELLDLLDLSYADNLEPPTGVRDTITGYVWRTHVSLCTSTSEVQGMTYSNFGVMLRVVDQKLAMPPCAFIARNLVM
ncbi:hypothetical protein SmJEL517_g03546 [Synchytrium microbalum]|uniref:F-box domain-containing protein n=1 Tax=Synchytrium microbalum TaxID=1806994 RepID=A0A507C2I0_9FUNG|nr:uncharacterized protein SmJEL517_g03546 [Synchytrium microbalum]TPX33568.1 hypothetical protein SmJEL517_g03546 [Synchytrium microbalum]